MTREIKRDGEKDWVRVTERGRARERKRESERYKECARKSERDRSED